MISREDFLNCIGHFSWNFANEFFIETPYGNYIWKDPSYPDGDNTIRRFNGNHDHWLKQNNISFSRDKGKHLIATYCGNDVIIEGKL